MINEFLVKGVIMSTTMKQPVMDIYFRVWGDALEPAEVSNILKIQPTMAMRKGEKQVGRQTGNIVIAKTGKWFLDIGEYIHSNNVADYIQFILKILRELDQPLYDLKGVEKLQITFVLQVREDVDDIEFDLKSDLLKEVIKQDIDLSFAII